MLGRREPSERTDEQVAHPRDSVGKHVACRGWAVTLRTIDGTRDFRKGCVVEAAQARIRKLRAR